MQSLIIGLLAFLASAARAQTDAAEDGLDSVEPEANCTNGPPTCNWTDEEVMNAMYEYIYPRNYEWFFIVVHSVVFVVGLVGNALVCLAVYRNHTMRTVTNYFIVNLAVADLLVIIVCLPPTVVWDVTETWFLGHMPCKIVPYLQVSAG